MALIVRPELLNRLSVMLVNTAVVSDYTHLPGTAPKDISVLQVQKLPSHVCVHVVTIVRKELQLKSNVLSEDLTQMRVHTKKNIAKIALLVIIALDRVWM